MNPSEKCPLCDGEGFDSGGVEFNGLPTPPLPCPLCIEREARQKAEANFIESCNELDKMTKQRNELIQKLEDDRANNQKLRELCEEAIEWCPATNAQKLLKELSKLT